MDNKYPYYKCPYLIHGVLKPKNIECSWFNACTFICQWDTQRPIEMACSKYLLNTGRLCRQEDFQMQNKVVADIKGSFEQQEKLRLTAD